MARASNIIQLLVAVAVIGLFFLIYPGVMVLFASAVGLVYVAAAVGALRGSRVAGWIATGFSAATALLATLGVFRFVGNGFGFLSGNFDSAEGIYWVPYAFLAIAISATLVVVLRLALVLVRSGESQP